VRGLGSLPLDGRAGVGVNIGAEVTGFSPVPTFPRPRGRGNMPPEQSKCRTVLGEGDRCEKGHRELSDQRGMAPSPYYRLGIAYQMFDKKPRASGCANCRTTSGTAFVHFHSYTVVRPVTTAGMTSARGLFLQKSMTP
jgi:hypothetical protein